MAVSPANLEPYRPDLSIDSPPTFPLVAITNVETPDDLRDFFDKGGITELAKPLDYILAYGEEEVADGKFVVPGQKPNEQFSVGWVESRTRPDRRSLIVQSNLGNLAAIGLFLSVPVETDSYRLAHGDIIASHISMVGGRRLPEPYLKRGQAPHIGQPEAAIKVHNIARDQLLLACGQIAAAHLSNK